MHPSHIKENNEVRFRVDHVLTFDLDDEIEVGGTLL